MGNNKTLRIVTALLIVISSILLFQLYSTNKKYNQLERKSAYIVDSLQDELFIEKNDNGRHEITRDEIFAKYPKVGKEYQQFYEHETE